MRAGINQFGTDTFSFFLFRRGCGAKQKLADRSWIKSRGRKVLFWNEMQNGLFFYFRYSTALCRFALSSRILLGIYIFYGLVSQLQFIELYIQFRAILPVRQTLFMPLPLIRDMSATVKRIYTFCAFFVEAQQNFIFYPNQIFTGAGSGTGSLILHPIPKPRN